MLMIQGKGREVSEMSARGKEVKGVFHGLIRRDCPGKTHVRRLLPDISDQQQSCT